MITPYTPYALYLDENSVKNHSSRVFDKSNIPTTNIINVQHYGADPTGKLDSTKAFELAASKKTSIFVPPGFYNISGSIKLTGYGVELVGSGRGGLGGTNLNFTGVTKDNCIELGYTGNSSNCCKISGMDISAPDRTGGFAILSNFSYRPAFQNLRFRNVYNGIGLIETLGANLTDVLMVNIMGEYGIHAYAGVTGSDILEIVNVTIAGHATITRTPTGKRCTGLHLDNVGSVMSHGLKILNGCAKGVVAVRTDPLATRGGGFFNATFMGIEFMDEIGMDLQAGHRWELIAPYIFGTKTGPGISIGPNVTNIGIFGGDIASNNGGGIVNKGNGVNLHGVCLALNGANNAAIDMLPGSGRTRIVGCQIGRRSNASGGQGVGVRIAEGVINTVITGNDFSGNTKHIDNLSTENTVIIRSNINVPDTLTHIVAPGSEDVRIGNDNGDVLRLAAKSLVSNRLTIVASESGKPVEMFAEGTDQNIDIRIKGKGEGKFMFGNYTPNTSKNIIGYLEVKDVNGTIRNLAVLN